MIMFINIRRKIMSNTSDGGSFHIQGHYIIKWQFQHLSAGRTY